MLITLSANRRICCTIKKERGHIVSSGVQPYIIWRVAYSVASHKSVWESTSVCEAFY